MILPVRDVTASRVIVSHITYSMITVPLQPNVWRDLRGMMQWWHIVDTVSFIHY